MLKTYNGWTNYETWAVKSWMDNDYGTYQYFQNLAKETKEIYDLAEQIKDYFEENNPLESQQASVYHDLMNAALSEVNWQEIAKSLKEEE